ncbi:MAG: penicillin-binding protein [Lachnospiraceae bacterium]|uniref:Penicillin-binding protein n=1 Tax=Dorea phocaeensis TaxID=2040291 RepID=A0A850HA88_9FIRM|nr:penicillin-binding protein [Lachnospiraceae bacterium]NSK13746.1 penicillin-binding protein [Dorea phocaeensis]NVH57125.1 penicillin-binding protein [Dorea phocaeensis]
MRANLYSVWERVKSGVSRFVQSRGFVAIIVFCVLSAILLQRVFYLQIVKGQEYLDDYKLQIQKTKEVQGTRGNIYDRNGKLLAYNELAYSVTIEDNGDYDSLKQKNKELNKVVSSVIQMVEANGDTVINNFGIILDNNNNYIYVAENDTQRLRFIADVFGKQSIDQLSKKQKHISAEGLVRYLCTDEVYGYGINQKKLSKEEVLKLVNVRYAISLNSYQKYISTTIAEDVSDETVADIMENLDTLQGVNVEEKSLRRYNDSYCFANMIGYTGQISQEEYDALSKEDQKKYDKNDTVGKSGLEKVMDNDLQGEKGELKLYVNNVGKVIETVKGKDPEAGNDLHLTIDADLQKAAYHILEQELAGILLAKIQNTLNYDRTQVEDGSDVIIPIGDVYHTFIGNDILDMNHFAEEDAGATEQEVSGIFTARKEAVKTELTQIFQDPNAAAYRDLSKEMQAYLTYLVTDILTTGSKVILSDNIDTNDATYKSWKEEESINVYTYLSYAISKNWIDTSLLKSYVSSNGDYSDSNELYQGIVSFLMDYIDSDSGFDKLVYKYLIKAGAVTGRQICMMLYEQNILEYDEAQYEGLNRGTIVPYDFIRGKIETLEITPGQLALEPCTGSMVATDPNTGEVLVCVSYPGYDNNRLANTMDSIYYNKLVTDKARPFYNNATQEKTAPGSTYKPLVAAAALTEGVVNTGTYLPCHGIYKKVDPNPKCWIYPLAHGSLNIEGAIENSCNCFFYETGYRMSLKDDGLTSITSDNEEGKETRTYYSSEQGLDTLKKYATMFGLGETSGLEIPESEPQISDDSSVPSAIGQGTNNYTTSQLARYITTVANKGNLFKLSLIDKVTTIDGEMVKDYTPEQENTLTDISSSTWTAVHNGMKKVISSAHPDMFAKLMASDVSLAGKTGTAQQSTTHPDHGLFVGFAPSESPEIAFAIRIANGYSSNYAAEVGRYVMEYYYGVTPTEEILTGHAAKITTSGGGD